MTTGIARELSRNVQTRLAETLERELNIVRHALDDGELAELMIEAAVMMARTTAASIAAQSGNRGAAAGLFEAALLAIVHSIETGTADALARTMKEMERRS